MSPIQVTDVLEVLRTETELGRPIQDSPQVASIILEDLLTHRETVFLICLGFMRCRSEAEDMTQETYLRALGKLGLLREAASSKAWLCRIARNACLD